MSFPIKKVASRWARVVPSDIADWQARWERERYFAAMHDDGGLTWREIGRREGGISGGRARQLGDHYFRYQSWPSPVERYLAVPRLIEFPNDTRGSVRRAKLWFRETVTELAFALEKRRTVGDSFRDWILVASP